MESRFGLPLAMLAGLGVVFGLWWYQNGEYSTEDEVFDKLEQATSESPPDAQDVVAAFDLSRECATQTCFFKEGSISTLTYEKGNIRPTNNGLIFQLEALSGACLRVKQIERRFGTAQPETVCTSRPCWYRTAQYEWGIIAFGLDQRNAQCASTVVINSMPYQRPKN